MEDFKQAYKLYEAIKTCNDLTSPLFEVYFTHRLLSEFWVQVQVIQAYAALLSAVYGYDGRSSKGIRLGGRCIRCEGEGKSA